MQPKFYLKGVYCDKCGKETVTETVDSATFREEAPRIPMSLYPGTGGISMTQLVYRPLIHTLRCDCGETRTFTK